MDPKSLSNIDPKLRETYARVMGTATAGSSVPSSPTPPPATPHDMPLPSTAVASESTMHPITPTNATADSVPMTTPTSTGAIPPLTINTSSTSSSPSGASPFSTPPPIGLQQTVKYEPQPLPSPASVTHETPEGTISPLLKTLYILGAIVFFTIYSIFWIKIFKLPFFF